MKKIIVLLLVGSIALSATAQRDVYRSGKDRGQRYEDRMAKKNQRALIIRIAAINKDYDQRIIAVRYDHMTRTRIKNRKIRQLEKERSVAIARCNEAYSRGYSKNYDANDRFNDYHR